MDRNFIGRLLSLVFTSDATATAFFEAWSVPTVRTDEDLP